MLIMPLLVGQLDILISMPICFIYYLIHAALHDIPHEFVS